MQKKGGFHKASILTTKVTMFFHEEHDENQGNRRNATKYSKESYFLNVVLFYDE